MDDTIAAPECPAWCTTTHNEPAGWEVTAGGIDTIKVCRHDVDGAEDADGGRVWLTMERFAIIDNGTVDIDEPIARFLTPPTLTAEGLLDLAATLTRLAGMISEPRIAAA